MSSSGFTFTFRVTIIVPVFVPGRSRVVQTHFFSFCTTRDRPGTKTEIIMVTLNVKVNSKEDTLAAICYTHHVPLKALSTLAIKIHFFVCFFLFPPIEAMSSDDDFRPSRPSASKKMFKHDPEDDSAAGGGGVVSKV